MANSRAAETVSGIPDSQAGRIRMVGETLYGVEGWKSQIGRGIAISRRTIYRYLGGKRSAKPEQIDDDLLDLMKSERLVSERRARRIGRLEKKFSRHIAHVAAAKNRMRSNG